MDGNTETDEILFDSIMNEAPAPVVVEQAAEQQTPADTQPRDESGKFAAKTEDAIVDPDVAAQAAVEGDGVKVPVAAVQAEREKARQARDEAETLRREMAELRGQVSVLTQQRQAPQTTTEKAKPKSFWENPDEFLSERLAPVQQTMNQQRFEMSRMLADEKFGADAVTAADNALGELIKANDPQVAAIQAKVLNARHPFAELVSWHAQQQAMAEIGNDPVAFRERERERLRAEILAEMGQGGQSSTPAPSTTTKPLTQLPKSLSKLPGGGNSPGEEDTSDAGLFKHAMGG